MYEYLQLAIIASMIFTCMYPTFVAMRKEKKTQIKKLEEI